MLFVGVSAEGIPSEESDPNGRDSSVAEFTLSEAEGLHRNDMRAFFNTLPMKKAPNIVRGFR